MSLLSYQAYLTEIIDSSYAWEKDSRWSKNFAIANIALFDPVRNTNEFLRVGFELHENEENVNSLDYMPHLPKYAFEVWERYRQNMSQFFRGENEELQSLLDTILRERKPEYIPDIEGALAKSSSTQSVVGAFHQVLGRYLGKGHLIDQPISYRMMVKSIEEVIAPLDLSILGYDNLPPVIEIVMDGSGAGKFKQSPIKLIQTILEIIVVHYKDFRTPIYEIQGNHALEGEKRTRGRKNAIGQRHRIYGKIFNRPEAKDILNRSGLVAMTDIGPYHYVVARGYEDVIHKLP